MLHLSNVNRSSSSSSNSTYTSRSRSRGRSNSITKNRKKAPPLSFKTSPGRKTNRKPGNYYSVILLKIFKLV